MKSCEVCGEIFSRPRATQERFDAQVTCGRRCAGILNNPRLSGEDLKGRYRLIKVDGKPKLEHRHVMECHLGRKLLPTEQVHHINHDRLDNRIENLEVVSPAEHGERHTFRPVTTVCLICQKAFTPHKTKRGITKTCSPACRGALATRRNLERGAKPPWIHS